VSQVNLVIVEDRSTFVPLFRQHASVHVRVKTKLQGFLISALGGSELLV
jgi:hypothetical protein